MKNDSLAYALEVVLDSLSLLDKELLDKLDFAVHCEIMERRFNDSSTAAGETTGEKR